MVKSSGTPTDELGFEPQVALAQDSTYSLDICLSQSGPVPRCLASLSSAKLIIKDSFSGSEVSINLEIIAGPSDPIKDFSAYAPIDQISQERGIILEKMLA